jgi:acetyltransferase-like isoleucine patch superfamily enzyme
MLLQKYGAAIGNDVCFKDNLFIDNAIGDSDSTGDFSNLEIGDRCYIGKGVFLDLPDKILIQDECAISAGVKFICFSVVAGVPARLVKNPQPSSNESKRIALHNGAYRLPLTVPKAVGTLSCSLR